MQKTAPLLVMRRIKMLWDFRGPEAGKIAEHHEIHLKDYIKRERIVNVETGIETISEMYSIAFMIVNESDVNNLRQSLKPHRGQIFKDS